MFSIVISDSLDGGAIVDESSGSGVKGDPILLSLKKEKCLEPCGTFQQWFHFVASNLTPDKEVSFSIIDAGQSTFPDWNGYKVCLSYDLEKWERIEDTTFEDGKLTWTHVPKFQLAYYAYFPTYSRERQLRMLGIWMCSASRRCNVHTIGKTLDGRDFHLLAIGLPAPAVADRKMAKKLTMWVHARQHPGETCASWWIDGFVNRLLNESDAVTREVLKVADFFIVPNMNPDGGVRGHLRTNACGANLNREWSEPSQERSPEVFMVQKVMRTLGSIDLMFDIHQDEEKPYAFISKTPLGVPSCTDELRKLHFDFKAAYARACPDFETPGEVEPVGYPEPPAGKANLSICSAWNAETWKCLSMTLEMPYKGNPNAGSKESKGWTIENCVALGASAVDAIYNVQTTLQKRAEERAS
jgi:murein tripeptide amidase MpaA